LSAPPTQRLPSPKAEAGTRIASPCRKIESEFGSSPATESRIVSGAVVPLSARSEPPVAAELLQPRPGAPELAQGQGVVPKPEPSPQQKGVPAELPLIGRRRKASPRLVPAALRSVARK
jgi:hypothetical protein